MNQITERDSARIIDLARSFIVLRANGSLEDKIQSAGRPPRLDGYSIGTWETDRPAPHNGEMHPDGDVVGRRSRTKCSHRDRTALL